MYWIHPEHPQASRFFYESLASMVHRYNKKNQPLIFVCIGTPFILGDCLGPVIGSILSKTFPSRIYGTLDHPVHALNLAHTCQNIKKQHQKPFIIAIDAALGNDTQSGYILLKKGPLFPGKGVGKNLPPIGHLQIIGVFQDIFAPTAAKQMASFSQCISEGILKLYPSLQSSEQGHLIDILGIAAHRNAAGDPADFNSRRFN